MYVDKEQSGDAALDYSVLNEGGREIGLVKFDFLALKNLTLIKDTLDLAAMGGKTPPDLNRLNLDDPETYRLLARGNTGVSSKWKARECAVMTEVKPWFRGRYPAISLFRPGTLDAGHGRTVHSP